MHASDVKTFFETAAAEWDTMRLTYYDERVIETITDAIAIDDTQPCSTSAPAPDSSPLALPPRADRVIAIDNSPAMLDVARDNLAQLGIDNVEIREADLTQLPVDDDSIDAAVANMVLHRAEDPASMVAEMTRVVRPGGWVAMTNAVEHPYEWMRTEQADIRLGFTPSTSRASSAPRDWPDTGTRPSGPVKHPVHDLGRGRRDRNLFRLGASPTVRPPADLPSAAA